MKAKIWTNLIILANVPTMAHATSIAGIPIDSIEIAPALQVMLLLTLISLIPSLLITMSSFTRIVIVLSMLRTALGLQQTPPNSVLISLSLFLTIFTMMPVANAIYDQAYLPLQEKRITLPQALTRASQPIKQFMLKQTKEQDLRMMVELSKQSMPNNAQDIGLSQLLPAFLLSELHNAFQIGFMIFLPFLLIDLIVSGILMTMGMMMVPPSTISLPIKILVFVLINGWNLVIQSLVTSFD